ncbi:hypothetical protein BaRGS_00030552, partial [Batillaria attramentaria]
SLAALPDDSASLRDTFCLWSTRADILREITSHLPRGAGALGEVTVGRLRE